MTATTIPKHEQVRATLAEEIGAGRWPAGGRMPSEADLVDRFGVSRITVSRAMRDLQRAGLVERRPGSGTYVREPDAARSRSFGLLIPDLGESEIFEPICRGMMASPLAGRHALLWGNTARQPRPPQRQDSKAGTALSLCEQFIERRVAGVFFAPLEHAADQLEVNRRIVRALDRARIPLVLLDRPLLPFPEAPGHDLVGIDNRAAGYIMTRHLLRLGCERLHFVSLAGAASTVDDREAGFREALYDHGRAFDRSVIHRVASQGDDTVRTVMEAGAPDGIVCANDRTAALWMHALLGLGYRIPDDVRLIGIDDLDYASLLPVPLTTLRQPARRIGDTALGLMLERLERPDTPPRDVRFHCELVVRDSCGSEVKR